LPLLEILDLSRNKITTLPDEIKKLSSLRVLSIMQNRLEDLPSGLSDMNKLQILKVAGNPLQYPLRRTLEDSENDMASSAMTDNEKEVAVTADLKRFLKVRQQANTPEPEGGNDTRYVLQDMRINGGLTNHPVMERSIPRNLSRSNGN
jgi:Leucine-rich repeat (LRR) protein